MLMKKFILLLSLMITLSFLLACSDDRNMPSGEDTSRLNFSSAEEAYYYKYIELAEKYGTHTLYDVNSDYSGRSYLSGVCAVNLMDFNGDGIQDLFVVYSNGQTNKIISDGFNLEIYDFPDEDTYEVEIWTYKNEELVQLLHETSVSSYGDYCTQYFITVYENGNDFPVIQIYDNKDNCREYTNIYYSGEEIVRDKLTYNGDSFQMNDTEITEDIWSENITGFNKILLCSLLADSRHSSNSLAESYGIDYNHTLLQTEIVIRYLSQTDKTPVIPNFYIAEGEYISLYLQEIERSNRLLLSPETTENHYFNLYDMDQNGVPELILYEGSSGAGMHYHFYTIINGKITECGSYGRTSLCVNGEGRLIAYYGRMNGYDIKEITFNGDTISLTDIASGYTEDSYPELEEFGYENYQYLVFCPPTMPLVLYTYNQTLPIY